MFHSKDVGKYFILHCELRNRLDSTNARVSGAVWCIPHFSIWRKRWKEGNITNLLILTEIKQHCVWGFTNICQWNSNKENVKKLISCRRELASKKTWWHPINYITSHVYPSVCYDTKIYNTHIFRRIKYYYRDKYL